jgi:hypothetical protein
MQSKEMSGANPDPDLPHPLPDQDPLPVNNDDDHGHNLDSGGTGKIDDGEDDEDDGDVAGPTVEAHVDLAKRACKCCANSY